MRPHLVRWHEKYGAKGLTIVDVHNGRIDADRAALWKASRKEEIPFVVAHDAGERTVKAYDIRAYPTSYLIGRDGKVLWEGFPLPHVDALEGRIRQALDAPGGTESPAGDRSPKAPPD